MHISLRLIVFALAISLCAGSTRYIGYWGCHPGGHTSTLAQLQNALNRGYNTIVFAFYNVDANGALLHDPGAIATPTKSSITSNSFTYLVSLFGGQNGAAPTLTIPATQWAQNMYNNFITLRNTYGFDGIDIDLENAWGGTGDQIVCGLRAFFRLMHNAGYLVSMAPQTTALTPEVTTYSTGSWNSYAPLADTSIIDYVDIVAVQLYNNAVPYNDPVAYANALINGFQVSNCPACGDVTCTIRIPACKIAFGYPSTVGAAPSGCPGLPGGCPYGSSLTSLYNGSPVLKSTTGTMTWSVEWDEYGGWQFITASRNIAWTGCGSSATVAAATTAKATTTTTTAKASTATTAAAATTTAKASTATTAATTAAAATTATASTGSATCAGRATGIYCISSSNFLWCPENIVQSCAPGTVCYQNGNSIYCGF